MTILLQKKKKIKIIIKYLTKKLVFNFPKILSLYFDAYEIESFHNLRNPSWMIIKKTSINIFVTQNSIEHHFYWYEYIVCIKYLNISLISYFQLTAE